MNADVANDTNDAARRLQRALYRAAKARPERRFHALYDKVYREDILKRAWEEVRANGGAAGVDGQTIRDVERQGVDEFLATLASELQKGKYRPRAVRQVLIPKADGRQRALGIPTVRDRVVQAAAKVVLEPIFEADFHASSYGFRPKRSAHQAVEQVRQGVNGGRGWVVDADIEACFDRIDHDVVLERMGRRISDRRMLKLVRQWLAAGVEIGGVKHPTDLGVPQGGVISPLLANIVLHELDQGWEREHGRDGWWVRYADDFVIVCRTQAAALTALTWVGGALIPVGLTLHPTKTRIVNVGEGREGFEFLGFHCRKVRSWRVPNRRYLLRWPSQQALQSIRERVKAITDGRARLTEPTERVVAEINRAVRGWGAYFRDGNSSRQFGQIDSYVRERIALWDSKKHGRSGRRWQAHSAAFFRALGVYQLSGTVRWTTATPRATR